MEKECICCGQKRRVDRMSVHLYEKHRDNIINTAINKTLLGACIKEKNGFVRIVLKTDTGSDNYWVSFGYNSGWSAKPKMGKVLEKIKEHRDEHLVKCEALYNDMVEIEKEKKEGEKKEETEDMKLLTSRYDDLLNKYKQIEKKKDIIENSNNKLRIRVRCKDDTINALLKLMKIDYALYEAMEQSVGCIWNDYPSHPTDMDVDEENEKEREAAISRITLEEIKKEAYYEDDE
jgi:hypothetical protein